MTGCQRTFFSPSVQRISKARKKLSILPQFVCWQISMFVIMLCVFATTGAHFQKHYPSSSWLSSNNEHLIVVQSHGCGVSASLVLHPGLLLFYYYYCLFYWVKVACLFSESRTDLMTLSFRILHLQCDKLFTCMIYVPFLPSPPTLPSHPSAGGSLHNGLVLLTVERFSCRRCLLRGQAPGFCLVPGDDPYCNKCCINETELNYVIIS